MRIYVVNDDYNLANYGKSGLGLQKVIYVQPTDTIASLISRVQSEFNISDEEIWKRIIFHKGVDLLSSGGGGGGSSTLELCGIEDYAILVVGFNTPFSARILTSDGRELDVEVSPLETYGVIKKRVGEKPRLGEVDHLTILSMGFFETRPNSQKFYIPLDGSSFPVDKFWIMVLVRPTGKQFTLNCKPTDTIRDVWEAIRNRSQDPDDKVLYRLKPVMEGLFFLFYNSKPLKDCATLDECGIGKTAHIHLLGMGTVHISVSVPKTQSCFHLDVECFLTVLKLKELLYLRTKIPVSQQQLTHDEYSLDDEDRLLQDYSIGRQLEYDFEPKCSEKEFLVRLDILEPSNDQTVDVRKPSFIGSDNTWLQVVIEIPSIPLRFPLEVMPTSTIGDLRRLIEDKGKIKKSRFVLFSDRKQLEDDSITLDGCGIESMNYIQVLEKGLIEIVISFLTEEPDSADTIRVRVACFSTIGSLKERLEVRTGIPKDQQRLMYHKVDKWFMDNDPNLYFVDRKTGMPQRRQRLIYYNWFLDDDKSLLVDYGIVNCTLANNPVKHGRAEFLIYLFTSTVDDPESGRYSATKAGLSSCEYKKFVLYAVPPPNPRSRDNSSELTFSAALADLSIPTCPFNDSSTMLIQIGIEIPNMMWRFSLVCKPTDEVGTVRKAVCQESYYRYKELFGQKYIKEGRFVLAFDREQLLDESITLDKCGIGHMDSIQLLEDEYVPIDIYARTKRLYTRIGMKCFDSVRSLKEEIFRMSGIPPPEQHLSLSDGLFKWWLDDDEGTRRLVDYGMMREVQHDNSPPFRKSRPLRKSRPKEILSVTVCSSRHFLSSGYVLK